VAEYTKTWLSLDEQVGKLASRGVEMPDVEKSRPLLKAVGYYRLTGYLYPLRESERYADDDGRFKVRVLNGYRAGTSLDYAAELIDFDRRLRMLVLEGIERIEVSFRMQLGYVLGKRSAFAHLDSSNFVSAFTAERTIDGDITASSHQQWIQRVKARQAESDEAFVAHFRDKYDGQMPIWVLTEILELGQLSRLYSGL
jgi:abortive infection bacteriophage resistance protein